MFSSEKPVEYRAIIQPLVSGTGIKPNNPIKPTPTLITPSNVTKASGQRPGVPNPILIQPLKVVKN